MDGLTESVVNGALDGAVAGIRRRIGGSHTVEPIPISRTERQVRVKPIGSPDAPPRYFSVEVFTTGATGTVVSGPS